MNPRLCVGAGFAALLGATFFLTDGVAQPNTVRKVVDGVWFREGDGKNQGHCNNAIIEMKDYLIVVDANFPSGARLAMADAKKLSPKPVKYVFDTHHHGDHLYGNAIWTEAGATTLAYKGVVDELKRFEPGRWKQAAATRKDVADLHRDTAEPPKQTFSEPKFVLNDGTREVQFLHLGWAHTQGDAFAWLPKERVLCTGDAAANGAFNYTADANIGNWPKVLQAAQKLNPRYVLPGHGNMGGPEILKGQQQYFLELHKAVSAAVSSGKKLEDLVTMTDGNPSATSIHLPDSVNHWVGGGLPAQVKDAYMEISTGKPAGGLPHP